MVASHANPILNSSRSSSAWASPWARLSGGGSAAIQEPAPVWPAGGRVGDRAGGGGGRLGYRKERERGGPGREAGRQGGVRRRAVSGVPKSHHVRRQRVLAAVHRLGACHAVTIQVSVVRG